MGIRLNPGRTGRRVIYKMNKKDLQKGMQDWNDIWKILYKAYPNLQGHIDIAKFYQDVLDSLPDLDPETEDYITVYPQDLKTLSTILGKFVFDTCRLYDVLLKDIPIRGTIS